MRRSLAVSLSLLVAAAGLGVTASSAFAATGPDLQVGPATLLIPSPTGADPIPLDAGGVVAGDLPLDNQGDTTTAATLTIALTGFDPSTLEVRHANTVVTCAPGTATSVVCPVPDLPAGALSGGSHDAIWSFQVQQQPAAAAGTAVGIAFDLEPVTGTDANPADNTTALDFVVKPSADLQTSITPAPAVLVAGRPTTFTLTVRNAGPDTAPATTSVAILQTDDAGFTVASGDPAVVVAPHGDFSDVTWTVGDLAAGATRSTTFTVTAAAVGLTADIGVRSTSAATDPVPCTDDACNFDHNAHVTSVAAGSTGTGTGTGTRTGGPILANTGAVSGPATGLGLGLLAAGTVVLLGARRRVRD